ncbi:L-threonine dehydratase catabolic TdcB-like [Sphaerodactylus townsendi]|uniref:L-threonine dehydratase catabolic TdcB-like n=1 Tax=Sphaerodactylus townsendi TaxID=933632 RepID=UPI002026B259|nr:L-threonine dehydratase catabolic TdcB-like [Sphaerodactylus townsendi]
MNFVAQFFYSGGIKNQDPRRCFEEEEEEEYDPFWPSSAKKLFVKKDESTEGKLEVPTHCDRHCFKDGPIGNGPIGQRSSSITPERMKDFGEEDYLNGGVKTWEMKIVSHSEELLRDLPIRPERVSLTAHNKCIRFEDISAAAFKIQCGVQKTPCMYSRLSKQYGMDLYLKKEFLQYTGSVKERGVLYLLLSLQQEQQRKGVIVASDSNFTMAVAYHATEHHIPVFVIMPTSTSPTKVKTCREYGAMVISYGASSRESQLHARRLAQENSYLYLEEEDNAAYLSGLGTMGMEIYEQVPKLDAVIFPAGVHCGLLAGSAVALKHLNPNIFVIGVESEGFPVLQQSLNIVRPSEERIQSIQPFYRDVSGPCMVSSSLQLTGQFVDKVVTVREQDILVSILRLLEYERATIDAEGAIGLAAVIAGKLPELKGKSLTLLKDHAFKAAFSASAAFLVVAGLWLSAGDSQSTWVTCIVETRDKLHTAQLRNTLIDRYPMMLWTER